MSRGSLGSLVLDLRDNSDQTIANLENIEQHLQNLTDVMEDFANSFDRNMGRATDSTDAFVAAGAGAGVVTGVFNAIGRIADVVADSIKSAASAIVSFTVDGVKLAAQYEQAGVSFETFLGSAEKGNKVLKEMQTFADTTPFRSADLQQAGKLLLAYGVAGDDLLPTLRRLGDLAAGDSDKLRELSLVYGQVSQKGTLQAQDTNQFAERGVGLTKELGKYFGISTERVLELREAGLITFKDVDNAIQNMTSSGGAFFGMTERQGRTLTGTFSTLEDTIEGVQRRFGLQLAESAGFKNAVTETTVAVKALGDAFSNDLFGSLTKVGGYGRQIIDFALDGIELLSRSVGYFADYLVAAYSMALKGVIAIPKEMANSLASIPGVNQIPGFKDLQEFLNIASNMDISTNFGDKIGESFDRARDSLAKMRAEADMSAQLAVVKKYLDGVRDLFGGGASGQLKGILPPEMTKRGKGGPFESLYQSAQAFAKGSVLGMEETQKRIESIVKANRTPIEKYADTVAELNTLFAQGLIDPNTFSNGLTNAVSDAMGRAVESRKVEEKALRSGGIAGLQDAFNMVQRGALSDPLTDATKDAAKAARESAKASNKNASALDIATDLLRKGIPVFVGR